jgi:hypothetical protein
LNSSGNKLNLNFHPNSPGIYPCKLLLYSLYDVRVYDVEGISVAKSKLQLVEFNVLARQSVTQLIPITNGTKLDWVLKATFKQENGKCFSGPSELAIPAGKTATYPLIFRPTWMGNFLGNLVLSNYPLGEWVYNLKGVAEEPLAEDNIVVECQAKTKTVISLPVKYLPGNSNSSVIEYKVESNVPYVSGCSQIQTSINQISKYDLTVQPKCSGNFGGSISFIAPDGQYLWYSIEIHASIPTPERQLTVSTEIRKGIAVEIR